MYPRSPLPDSHRYVARSVHCPGSSLACSGMTQDNAPYRRCQRRGLVAKIEPSVLSNKDLPGLLEEPKNRFLRSGINPVHRSLSIGATQLRRGAIQTTDQWALVIDRAALWAQVRTTPFIQSFCMLGCGLHRKTSQLLGRGRNRAAAVMTTDDAGKRRNLPT